MAASTSFLTRVSGLLAGVWLGGLVTLGAVVAPTAFAQLERTAAGRLAGACFKVEAHVALALAIALFVIERHVTRERARSAGGSMWSANMLLALGALFCTIAGYFALQPMMEAARLGAPGAMSFGLLHGASSVFFLLKGLLVAVFLWRVLGRAAH
jgi:hypothetical protein